ncbi:MAG TPA: ribonuclease D, partial [Candidatus Methylacidiphilales bacterium]
MSSLWVDSLPSLEAYTSTLRHGAWLAIDTEADSLHHYKESVCLVSVRQGNHTDDVPTALIDPLSLASADDLAPFWAFAASSPWILQGADFDLRMMRRIGAPEPTEVFDTMIGAQLCGLPGIGYAALVERFFGVILNKASQKEDWSARPLTPAMYDYAAQDVTYLDGIRERLTEQLVSLGRLDWHKESSARVVRASRVVKETDPDEVWRINGSNKLPLSALPILRELWHWRDAEARERDLPTYKVLTNDRMLEITVWVDEHRQQDHVPHHFLPSNCRGARLIRLHDALDRGREYPPFPAPERGPRLRRSGDFERRVEAIRKGRDEVAAKLALDPSLIASKTVLFQIADEGNEG